MDSQDLESHRAEEAAPLLDPATTDHDDLFEDDAVSKPPVPVSSIVFFIGFSTALILAAATLGLNITHALLAIYGKSEFEFHDWDMSGFREAMFWGTTISIVAHIANVIHLARARKPLPTFINFFITLALLLTFIISVSNVVRERNYSTEDYCKPTLRYPGYPEEPTPDPNSPLMDPDTMQQCHAWAAKTEIIAQVLILIAGLHGVVLAGLFIAIIVNIYRHRYVIWSSISWPKNFGSSLGPGHLAFEVSIRWGGPKQSTTDQNQPQQEQNLIDQQ